MEMGQSGLWNANPARHGAGAERGDVRQWSDARRWGARVHGTALKWTTRPCRCCRGGASYAAPGEGLQRRSLLSVPAPTPSFSSGSREPLHLGNAGLAR